MHLVVDVKRTLEALHSTITTDLTDTLSTQNKVLFTKHTSCRALYPVDMYRYHSRQHFHVTFIIVYICPEWHNIPLTSTQPSILLKTSSTIKPHNTCTTLIKMNRKLGIVHIMLNLGSTEWVVRLYWPFCEILFGELNNPQLSYNQSMS